MATEAFNLERFVSAQDSGGAYSAALVELGRGRKTSHWMWFVFPQIAGLGQSATSRFYAISGVDEARAYLAHPVLGPRLADVTRVVFELAPRSADSVFGSIDALKLRSSMTLFARAVESGGGSVLDSTFQRVLDAFFDSREDEATLERL